MKRVTIFFVSILFTLNFANSLEVPKLIGRVNDYAGILSSAERQRLESRIKGLESSSSSQIAILTIKSLEGDNLEDFSIRCVDKWQLGTKENDNGVLLLIALKEKKIRIEVGYGLEGSLTDAKASYIIRNIISPDFSQGDIYNGLNNAVEAISGLISGEYTITAADRTSYSDSGGSYSFSFIFLLMFLLFSFLGSRGRRGRNRGGFLSLLLLNSLLGGGRSYRSGGFHSGFSSGGGFSSGFGGGFSGGGGGFGGGGASGGWS